MGNSSILLLSVAEEFLSPVFAIHWVSENFRRYALSKDSYRVSLIDGGPNISVLIQSDAVNSFKSRICAKEVI